jgi:hypothetical protein
MISKQNRKEPFTDYPRFFHVPQFHENNIITELFLTDAQLGQLYRCWRVLGLREVEAPTFPDIRLTEGGEAVSLTRGLDALYPHEDSWYSFLLEAESTPGP